MIIVNAGTMIDGKIYTCLKIEEGYAYLNEVGKRGRPRKILVSQPLSTNKIGVGDTRPLGVHPDKTCKPPR